MDSTKLPSRIFADGEEPVGDRVNSYFKLNTIGAVLKYLQAEELEQIRPCFGKLFEVYRKPAYSGKLAHFLLTRQLAVDELHEIWLIFSGKPIRFSLREFAYVTGLKCGALPTVPSELVKSKPGVAPYWFTLFGGEPFVTGEMLLSMLKRSRNLSSELRVKYAYLLLVDGMLCRRSAPMKIPREHVEMIRDLDYFLSYPWGRVAFDMTVQCIKTRQINQLAQPTIAIQGFIHALQLVVAEAVPAAVSAVGEGADIESGEDEPGAVMGLKLEKLWELDADETVAVTSILDIGGGEALELSDFSWMDEVEDPTVDYMVKHIGEGFQFKREHFRGGQRRPLSPAGKASRDAVNGKRKGKAPVGQCEPSTKVARRGIKARKPSLRSYPNTFDSPKIAEMVAVHIKEALGVAEGNFRNNLQSELKQMEDRVLSGMSSSIKKMVDEHMSSKYADATIGSVLRDITDTGISGGKATSPEAPSKDVEAEAVATGGSCLIEKFKSMAANPVPDRTFDFGDGLLLSDSDLINIPWLIPSDSCSVMDSCVMLLRETLLAKGGGDDMRADIMPSSFPSMLAKHHARFKKNNKKENFEFSEEILGPFRHRTEATGKEWVKDTDFIYFPFNLDRNRWVAVLVDLISSSLTVFDPTASAIRRSRLKPEFDFLCEMLPFFIRKAASCDEMVNFKLTPLTFTRDVDVLQVADRRHTGIVSVMFIEAHASGGLAKVYTLTEEMIPLRAEKLAVDMFELCCGDDEV